MGEMGEYDWLALNLVEGLGRKTLSRLLARFGTVQSVLQANRSALEEVVKSAIAERILKARAVQAFSMETRLVEQLGVRLLTLDSPAYPPLLKETDVPPGILYCRGNHDFSKGVPFSIVGTRNPTRYAERSVNRLVEGLAAAIPNLVLVSGMARGVDTVAHKAALANGLATVGVMGGGLTRIYPPENQKLAEDIMGHGALISEFPMTMAPLARNFPVRNRIISGISWGVLVAEAGEKSGALITAGFALNHNRDVFALPGYADAPQSVGPNQLLKRGQAKLVTGPEDILEELGPRVLGDVPLRPVAPLKSVQEKIHPPDSEKGQVLAHLAKGPLHLDELAAEIHLTIERIQGVVLELELSGEVEQTEGNQYALS